MLPCPSGSEDAQVQHQCHFCREGFACLLVLPMVKVVEGLLNFLCDSSLWMFPFMDNCVTLSASSQVKIPLMVYQPAQEVK